MLGLRHASYIIFLSAKENKTDPCGDRLCGAMRTEAPKFVRWLAFHPTYTVGTLLFWQIVSDLLCFQGQW